MRTSALIAAIIMPAVFALPAAFTLASPARAEMVSYNLTMLPDNEVPPVEGLPDTTGQFQGEFDTQTGVLTYTMGYQNLTGAPTAAHLHGPAGPEENAGVLVPLDVAGSGEVTLNAEQAAALGEGQVYVNVHTEANPKGELRVQLVAE